MDKTTIMHSIMSTYGKYGIERDEIESIIDDGIKKGQSYDYIYFFLHLASADVCGFDYFWCTPRQMARAFNVSDEKMQIIIKDVCKEIEEKEDGLDDLIKVPVEIGEKFFASK